MMTAVGLLVAFDDGLEGISSRRNPGEDDIT